MKLTNHQSEASKLLIRIEVSASVRMRNFHKHHVVVSRLLLHLIIVLIFHRLQSFSSSSCVDAARFHSAIIMRRNINFHQMQCATFSKRAEVYGNKELCVRVHRDVVSLQTTTSCALRDEKNHKSPQRK